MQHPQIQQKTTGKDCSQYPQASSVHNHMIRSAEQDNKGISTEPKGKSTKEM